MEYGSHCKCSPRQTVLRYIHKLQRTQSNQSPIAMTDSVRKLFIIQRFSGLKQQETLNISAFRA